MVRLISVKLGTAGAVVVELAFVTTTSYLPLERVIYTLVS